MRVPTHRTALRTRVTKPRQRLARLLLPAVLGAAAVSPLLAGAGGSGEQLLLWEGLQGASSLVHPDRETQRGSGGDTAPSGVPARTVKLKCVGGHHSPGRDRQASSSSRAMCRQGYGPSQALERVPLQMQAGEWRMGCRAHCKCWRVGLPPLGLPAPKPAPGLIRQAQAWHWAPFPGRSQHLPRGWSCSGTGALPASCPCWLPGSRGPRAALPEPPASESSLAGSRQLKTQRAAG